MSTQDGDRPLALVTGASSGIGRSLAWVFVEHGYDLVVAAEDDALHTAAARLDERGAEVLPVQVDLSTPDGVETLHEQVRSLGRPVDAAALNAGIAVGGEFRDTDLDDDLRLVDLNCRSTVHLAKLLVRDMVQAGQGRLLFTSSIASAAPTPYQATYGASKAFVQSFAEALRHELQGTGVTVTALLPGPTDTEIFDRGGLEDTRLAQGHKDDPDDVARDAYEALVQGRSQVVTGSVLNKLQVAAAGVLPDPVKSAVVTRQTKPGTGKDV